MGGASSILKDQELSEFRKLKPGEDAELELPTPPAQRTLTDKKGFIIFGLLMLTLFPFLIYTLVKSDIRRLSHGYDSCGNLCGVKNAKIDGLNCSGQDFTDKPYEAINILTKERRCTDECPPGYIQDDDSCYGGEDFGGDATIESVNLWAHALSLWWKFVIVFIITTILCSLTLLLFRYFPAVIVWTVSVVGIIVAIVLTCFFWFAFSQWEDIEGSKSAFLTLALMSTIFTVVIIVIFIVLIKKMPMIIALYKETTKALFDMPLLMILPIVTLLLQFIILTLMVVTSTYMGTSAELRKFDNKGHYFYENNGVMRFTIAFNVIVTIWALQFFSGCQYMVTAGSVGQWFFKKDQANSPISISFTNTLRFHLGTIAFGSFFLTLISVLKALIKNLLCNSKLKCLVDCCCGGLEAWLKFLSKNAYIETAIYGQSFFRSGKRAAKMLLTNAKSVISLNSVGDFVLAMTQFLLLAISTAIAYGIFMNNSYAWAMTLLSFFVNLIVVVVVFSVFETIVDTLFICFCEDMSINDGSASKPYYMTTSLRQFIDKSEQLYKNEN